MKLHDLIKRADALDLTVHLNAGSDGTVSGHFRDSKGADPIGWCFMLKNSEVVSDRSNRILAAFAEREGNPVPPINWQRDVEMDHDDATHNRPIV
jgi:hypothetical protein